MAEQFIGLRMRVTLRDPAAYKLDGTIRDVAAGSSLTLTNVFVVGTKNWAPEMRINAMNIADLTQIEDEKPSLYNAPPPAPEPAALPARPPRQAFEDPAILSFGRTTAVPDSTVAGPEVLSTPELALDLEDSDLPGVLRGIHVGRGMVKPLTPIQDVVEAIDQQLRIENGGQHSEAGKATDTEGERQRRKRRRNKAKKQHAHDSDVPSSPGDKPSVPTNGRGKGWRQTPMLQSTASFQPFSSLKKQGRGGKGAADNGWESADVTEEMGEFDFENNLAKFDKRAVFDQMRKEDQIDDASRLVAHNRRPKPGTGNGKNLHYTENVLDLPPSTRSHADFWNSEADEGLAEVEVERLNGRDFKGAPALRRAESKNGISRRSRSRKASSGMTGGHPLTRVNSGVSHYVTVISPIRYANLLQQAYNPGLYLLPSNRRVEAISTLQMLNLENIAANEVGFTEELMAENAGRGIAEVAIKALSDPAMKVRFELATNSSSAGALLASSSTVILAGNNKSSIRALAAARHLRNRNIDVVVCVVGIERERDLMEDLRRQIALYRAFGGRVLSKNEFFEHLRKNAASGASVPVSLIVDAMLGLTMSFEELRVGDQASVYELMEWANRNEAFVLAVDIPSGIEPTSGKIAIIDGGPLFVKPRYVVAMGAPKRGLLEAVTPPREDEPGALHYAGHEDDWRLFVADMGLGSAVWKKAGTKLRRGIDFSGNWVLEMEYRTDGYGSARSGEH
ncbi:YjeF-related protein N-terminus-domain-containing protein [Emericellopsis atlantica]|uniref:Enhancer of mRNA-decapping protein 3 n=1 Tax=Emericellopsis atlantica TaxID=2614577 RepID=A0A9P7ZKX8_9HYPO|nr:YjeF-related protein N-terminus-domain-containing protein [Emericellopsis atlantica]KAG9253841.1 YjeF-related protein N-terminus-domain-containing protein [Emericellopsis atlantica]